MNMIFVGIIAFLLGGKLTAIRMQDAHDAHMDMVMNIYSNKIKGQ
jgi:hypothetical protein